MKKIVLVLMSIVMIFALTACNFGEHTDEKISGEDITNNEESGEKLETNDKYAKVEKNPIATMEMTDGSVVKIELYPKIAPTTVENFIYLSEHGFYDGLTFHRVIPEFMAQGGDPSGDGTGGPGYSIKGEFSANGFKNDLSHEIGVISMARTSDNNGAGSQFFIVTHEQSYLSLDGLYAGFGKVIEGMEHVNTIVNSEVIRTAIDDEIIAAAYPVAMKLQQGEEITDEEGAALDAYYVQAMELDKPINPPVIKSLTVETFGVDYDQPAKIVPQF